MFVNYGHLRNIDCLTAHIACLVCFISTVNGRSKKRRKRSLLQVALVAGTQLNLSSLYYLDVYVVNRHKQLFEPERLLHTQATSHFEMHIHKKFSYPFKSPMPAKVTNM
jgi:hypothetical protein